MKKNPIYRIYFIIFATSFAITFFFGAIYGFAILDSPDTFSDLHHYIFYICIPLCYISGGICLSSSFNKLVKSGGERKKTLKKQRASDCPPDDNSLKLSLFAEACNMHIRLMDTELPNKKRFVEVFGDVLDFNDEVKSKPYLLNLKYGDLFSTELICSFTRNADQRIISKMLSEYISDCHSNNTAGDANHLRLIESNIHTISLIYSDCLKSIQSSSFFGIYNAAVYMYAITINNHLDTKQLSEAIKVIQNANMGFVSEHSKKKGESVNK